MSFVFPKLRTHHSKSSVDLLIECAPLQSRRRAFLNLNLHPEGSSNKVVSPGRDSKWSNALYRTRLPSDSEAKPRRQEERMDVDDRAVATARARASTASTARTAALDNDDADAEAAASRLAAWRSIFFKRRRRKRGEVFSSFFVFLCLARARGERKKKKKSFAVSPLAAERHLLFSLSLSLQQTSFFFVADDAPQDGGSRRPPPPGRCLGPFLGRRGGQVHHVLCQDPGVALFLQSRLRGMADDVQSQVLQVSNC